MRNVAAKWIDVEYDALVNISWAFLNVTKAFIKKKVQQTQQQQRDQQQTVQVITKQLHNNTRKKQLQPQHKPTGTTFRVNRDFT